MRKYNFPEIKRFIQKYSDYLVEVQAGIQEDWFWTAETIYVDDRLTVNLDDPTLHIAGIQGSSWGTPVICATFKDGAEQFIPMYSGEKTEEGPDNYLGCLSSIAQQYVNDKTKVKQLPENLQS